MEIDKMINNVNDAERLAYKYFKDKVDKGDNPYMEHLQFVANSCLYTDAKIVGMLHDIIEDTDINMNELENELPINLIESIQHLSKQKDIKYSEYIDNLCKSNDLLAMEVKMHDLEHNMDLSRLKKIEQIDLDRKRKYKKAYKKICEKYKELLITEILKITNNNKELKLFLKDKKLNEIKTTYETIMLYKTIEEKCRI